MQIRDELMGNCPPFCPDCAINYCVTTFKDSEVNDDEHDDRLISITPPYAIIKAMLWSYHSHTPEVVIGWPDIGYWVNEPSNGSDDTELGLNMLYNEMILVD
jgi:hypothetical protein